jgi:hypothetical protein
MEKGRNSLIIAWIMVSIFFGNETALVHRYESPARLVPGNSIKSFDKTSVIMCERI